MPLEREHVSKYLEEVRTEARWVSEGKAIQALVGKRVCMAGAE